MSIAPSKNQLNHYLNGIETGFNRSGIDFSNFDSEGRGEEIGERKWAHELRIISWGIGEIGLLFCIG